MLPRRISLLFSILSLFNHVQSSCYFPNGDLSPADVACNSGAADSFCCFSNQACLSNGLCLAGYSGTSPIYARGTCTDRNWESGACPKFCLDTQTGSGNPVYSCNVTGQDTYCCDNGCTCGAGGNTVSFTGTPYTITVIGSPQTFANPSATTAISSSSASSSASGTTTTSPALSSSPTAGSPSATTGSPQSTSTTSSSSSSSSTTSSGTNTTAIGVGVGVGVGGALIAAAIAFWFFRRRATRNQQQASSPYNQSAQNQGYSGYSDSKKAYGHSNNYNNVPLRELPSNHQISEMGSPERPRELAA